MTEILQSAITIVLFLFILAVLVVIHELGHFVTARLAGVRVLEFGLGFPPRAKVLSSHGETLYTLNWLPLGGFVRLEGEDGDSEDPRSFVQARLPVKLLILLAGVTMNLLLAAAIFIGTAWFPGSAIQLKIDSVQAGSPAAAAGIMAGEGIVSVDGRYWDQFDDPIQIVALLQAKAGQQVTLGIVSSNGQLRSVQVTLRSPAQIDDQHRALGVVNRAAVPSPVGFSRSLGDAVVLGLQRTGDAFGLVLDGLGQLVNSVATRPTEAPPVSGPVGIAIVIGDVFWQRGLLATLYIGGLLSANLALVNILPFPPLDGGRMLMLVIKRLAGNRVSLKAERVTLVVGTTFLFAFIIWVTFFDVARLGGAVP